MGAVARSGSQFAIVGEPPVSGTMVAFAIDRVLVRATGRGWQLTRKLVGNYRQRSVLPFRRLAKRARNSGESQGDLGDRLRFRTCRAEFLRYFGFSVASTSALLRAG